MVQNGKMEKRSKGLKTGVILKFDNFDKYLARN